MKKLFYGWLIGFATFSTANAEEKLKHYEALKPANSKQAVQALKQDTAKINAIIAQDKELSEQDLEAIHELTYGLEASHEVLENGAQGGDVDALGDAIQNLHNVSEGHDANATLEAYQQLQTQMSDEDIAASLEPLTNFRH
jgi:hypothetical protein